MSKLSFRARALDAAKPMAVYLARELPDLPDFTIINRAVPQMPTGMEKEEETEHHLQRAIVAGLIIPTPEVYQVEEMDLYSKCYPGEWKVPRQLIHMQPFTMEQDIPDYDMDSEDEKWINTRAKKMDILPLQFEEMIDRLEKSSGQTVITLGEAKSLLKQDDDFIMAVYDYWLNKRLKMQHPLIPQVKTEKYGGTGSSSNPYIAFRRRTEKMQTRKHRKNDEASYEKMLKLRRDLSRALTLLEMVKKREKCKRENVHFGIEIYEKRYQLADYSGQVINELTSQVKQQQPRPSFTPLSTIHGSNVWPNQTPPMVGNVPHNQTHNHRPSSYKDELIIRKQRRADYRKRRHKKEEAAANVARPRSAAATSAVSGIGGGGGVLSSAAALAGNLSSLATSVASRGLSCLSDAPSLSSEDEAGSALAASQSDAEDVESDAEKQGPFAFRRKQHCNYLAPTQVASPWPWSGTEEGGLADPRYRFCLTSISSPEPRCIGFARRRIGRGGRVVLDRVFTPLDGAWSSLNGPPGRQVLSEELKDEVRTSWRHFRPVSLAPPSPSWGQEESTRNRTQCVSIFADGDDSHCQTFDTETIDNIYTDCSTDRWWSQQQQQTCAEADFPSSANDCAAGGGSSNFHVIGDETSVNKNDLNWWNYFDTDSQSAVSNGELGDCLVNGGGGGSMTVGYQQHNLVIASDAANKASNHSVVNGVSSPSTATDSPFWIVPKSASLPNNDCSIVSPCPGELHTAADKDQTSVADFLMIDSTFAMEVT